MILNEEILRSRKFEPLALNMMLSGWFLFLFRMALNKCNIIKSPQQSHLYFLDISFGCRYAVV